MSIDKSIINDMNRGSSIKSRNENIRRSRNKKLKRKKQIRARLLVMLLVLIAVIAAAMIVLFVRNKPYTNVVLETGTPIPEPDTLLKNGQTGGIYVDTQDVNINAVGNYKIKLKNGLFTYTVTLSYEDTLAPVVVPKKYFEINEGEAFKASDFIESVEDTTITTAQFIGDIPEDALGNYEVAVRVTDGGGNSVDVTSELRVLDHRINYHVQVESGEYSGVDQLIPQFFADEEYMNSAVNYGLSSDAQSWNPVKPGETEYVLTVGENNYNVSIIVEDTTAPVISGAVDKTVYIGENNSLITGVSATDNSGEEIVVKLDAEGVDYETEGSYQATYTAADSSGNETSVSVTVTVKKERTIDDKLNDAIDPILNTLINSGMTDEEKTAAIYQWVYNNISYKSGTYDYSDYKQGAIDAMERRYGDCFSYYSVSKAMLTRAGITNQDIRRISGTSAGDHFWNLVQIDGKWYHYDACRRAVGLPDNAKGYMFTDATAQAYMNLSPGLAYYYYYDESAYPDIE